MLFNDLSVFFKLQIYRIFLFFFVSFLFFSTLDEDYCLLLGFGLTVAILRSLSTQLLQSLVFEASFPVISRAYVMLFGTRLKIRASLDLTASILPRYKFHYLFKVSKNFPIYDALPTYVFLPNTHFLFLKFFDYLFNFYLVLVNRTIR